MPPGKKEIRFTSQLVRLESGPRYHVLRVPEEIAARWKAAKVRRVTGTINGCPVNRGLQHHAGGGSFLVLGRDLLKTIGLNRRSIATLVLAPDPVPDEFAVPEELLLALEHDERARVRWESFPPGRRRSLVHYVTSAKQESTRIKRALELTAKIREHRLYGDRPKTKKTTAREE